MKAAKRIENDVTANLDFEVATCGQELDSHAETASATRDPQRYRELVRDSAGA